MELTSEESLYFELGWRPTLLRGKIPCLEGWQKSHLAKEEFQAKYDAGSNVGIVTGWISNNLALVALDLDQRDLLGFDAEPWREAKAMMHSTSVGPRIVFYTDDPEVATFSKKVTVPLGQLTEDERSRLNSKAEGKDHITILEVLGEGRQFMAPPSRHPETGQELSWIAPPKPPEETLVIYSIDELKKLMDKSITRSRWVLEELFESSKAETGNDDELLKKWLEKIEKSLQKAGQTSNYLQFHCPFHKPDTKPSFVIHKTKFYAYDYHDNQTYSLKQLAKKLRIELSSTQAKSEKVDEHDDKKSQADRLISLGLAQKPALFHDQHKTPYARVNQDGVYVTIPIRSRSFKAWLANLMWHEEEKAPGTEALYGAVHVLEAMAMFEGDMHNLYNRVAPAEDGIWIDMADEKWRAIKVTAEGWRIIDNPPILFKRYSHQKALVEPKRNGDPWLLLDFMNIKGEDEGDGLLLLVVVISCLIPTIPHVIIILYGIQGSGKTLLFKLIRSVIDPSSIGVLSMPRDEREMIQQLDHHWCAFYDNITSLPSWISDIFCRAATGGGFSKRELYTDDEDIIYNFRRCVGVNGINIAAQRGDLLDRGLLFGLRDIPKDKRKDEKLLIEEFESKKAEILGGFLDILVQAIKLYPAVNLKELFRMADFTKWGCAITKALGKPEKEFIDAYAGKVRIQIEEAAHSSPVATVLIDFMENHKEWEGSPSNLFKALTEHAKNMGISVRQKAWPKAPHALTRHINELIPSLKALGIEVETGVRTGREGTRRIIMKSVSSASSVSNEEKTDDTDATDATSPISSRQLTFNSFELSEVVSCMTMQMTLIGECAYCGVKPATLTHSVKTFQKRFQVCEDCARQIKDYLKKGV